NEQIQLLDVFGHAQNPAETHKGLVDLLSALLLAHVLALDAIGHVLHLEFPAAPGGGRRLVEEHGTALDQVIEQVVDLAKVAAGGTGSSQVAVAEIVAI